MYIILYELMFALVYFFSIYWYIFLQFIVFLTAGYRFVWCLGKTGDNRHNQVSEQWRNSFSNESFIKKRIKIYKKFSYL